MGTITVDHVLSCLKCCKTFIKPSFAYFIIPQYSIEPNMPNLMENKSFTFAPIHHQHRVFHTATAQSVCCGHLWIGIHPEFGAQPCQCPFRTCYHFFSPFFTILLVKKHMDIDPIPGTVFIQKSR